MRHFEPKYTQSAARHIFCPCHRTTFQTNRAWWVSHQQPWLHVPKHCLNPSQLHMVLLPAVALGHEILCFHHVGHVEPPHSGRCSCRLSQLTSQPIQQSPQLQPHFCSDHGGTNGWPTEGVHAFGGCCICYERQGHVEMYVNTNLNKLLVVAHLNGIDNMIITVWGNPEPMMKCAQVCHSWICELRSDGCLGAHGMDWRYLVVATYSSCSAHWACKSTIASMRASPFVARMLWPAAYKDIKSWLPYASTVEYTYKTQQAVHKSHPLWEH